MSSPREPRWKEILTERLPERAGDIEGLMSDAPDRLVAELRDDPDMTRALVEADARHVLEKWFSPRAEETVVFTDGRVGAVGDQDAGAEWVFAGHHDQAEVFRGLPATGRPVEVHGFTVVATGTDEEGRPIPVFTRHIDWAGLYAQLGLTINWRVPLDPEPDG
ncbi:MAG TPA: hypothetical protein VFM27_02960 [Acidimicrobiales bacterium]|nr:hypothetical protein [Acidimicrobiales bacterium]